MSLLPLLLAVRAALLPIEILYGKIPDPPGDLLLRAIVRAGIILAPAILFQVLAWISYVRGNGIRWWLFLMLLAAPASILTFLWTGP
ncbi:hypothetical protein [Sphingomonas sp. NIBR02145]|uniref:hypothetical protein n=1 Tax=Sphingomonas sp. NIBR02145 TaxID=3014784 RepID=UPI0022B417A4|nr:hypothetical protein [Sphingomonas sp. NIBR02145]WHU01308.1 hypothetical protein O3305_13970 [Sphingomonas sp. NIBR02145]